MLLPGREWQEGYRFGFNGNENIGLLLTDFIGRYYNNGLGVFLSVDPLYKHFCMWSPYSFALNQPISKIDYSGLGPIDPRDWERMSSYRLIYPSVFSGKRVVWLNVYTDITFTEKNTWTAHDKSLVNWGNTVTSYGDEHAFDKLAEESEMYWDKYYDRVKIAAGSEYFNRFGYIDERYNRSEEKLNRSTIMACGYYGNYDFKISEKSQGTFSIYEVTDGIITGIIDYAKNNKNEYEIVSSTSFIIEKSYEVYYESIIEDLDYMPNIRKVYEERVEVWTYTVTEIHYDVKSNKASTKTYSHSDTR